MGGMTPFESQGLDSRIAILQDIEKTQSTADVEYLRERPPYCRRS
jgi:hypothetical protein